MKKHFSRIFAVLLVVSMLFTQFLMPVSAEVTNCLCDSATRKGTLVDKRDATCGTPAYEVYTCKECKGTYVDVTAEATGVHIYVDHEAKAATCTENGWKAYQTCETCDYTSYEEIPAAHRNEWILAKDPTCTEDGWTKHTKCAVCGETSLHSILPAHGHIKGEPVEENIVIVGCENAGSKDIVYYCTVCGEEIERTTVETAPATNHKWIEIGSKPALCLSDGRIDYACEYCRERRSEILAATGHDYEVVITVKPTCDTEGEQKHICKECGYEKIDDPIPALGHKLTKVEGKAATCTEDGYTTYYICTRKECADVNCDGIGCDHEGEVCGYKKNYKDLPALGHNYPKDKNDKEIETVVAPTCSAEGYTYKTCSVCGYVDKYNVTPINPLAHKVVTTKDYVAPTCTEVGYTIEASCEYCGIVIDSSKEIPALDHDYVAVVTDPTCVEDGYTTHTCSRCKDTYVDSIVKCVGYHADKETFGVVEVTCTTDGYDISRCLICKETFIENVVPALGHDIVKVEAKAETCTENGHEAYEYCTRCDHTTYVEIDEIAGHQVERAPAKAPTCTEKGWTAYNECHRCGEKLTPYFEFAPKGHNIVKVDALEATCTTDGHNAHEYCTECDYTTKVVYPAGHRNEWILAKDATCTEEGWSKHTKCARCGEESFNIRFAPLGHIEVIDEAIQPTYDTEGLTEGSHCERCGEVLVEQVVIKRIKEEVNFSYEATGINGSETVVNSGYVTVNVYMDVVSTKARVWAVDLNMLYNTNFTLLSVDGCILANANYTPLDAANAAGDVILSQDMGIGAAKEFEEGKYLFATLTFKVDKAFCNENAAFEIVADNCVAARDFENELLVDFGTGVSVFVDELADVNNDGRINSYDSMEFAQWFATAEEGAYEAIYDLNKDGKINGDDFALYRGAVVRDYSYLDL